MHTKTTRWLIGIALWLLSYPGGEERIEAAAQANSQYLIERDVINAGGQPGQSASYQHLGSLGQASPLSSSSNDLYVLYVGFWHGKAFTLAIEISGTGTGMVKDCHTISDCPGERIDCGSDCIEFYGDGETVLLQAFPDPDSTFDGWLVNGIPISEPISVTQDLTVTAIFTENETNQPPTITSTPPSIQGQVYMYDVEATDPDGDPLTYHLLTAPPGMTIDDQTGLIVWEATIDQIGDHQVELQVDDGQGGIATQTFILSVTAEIFSATTIRFFDGFDAEHNIVEHDPTVLSLVPGMMSATDEILLPNLPNVFDFSAAVNFHVEYQPSGESSIVWVPAQTISAVLLNKPYAMVDENDIAGLTVWSAGQQITNTETVIFLTSAGQYFKIGNFQEHPDDWTVSFNYTELQP